MGGVFQSSPERHRFGHGRMIYHGLLLVITLTVSSSAWPRVDERTNLETLWAEYKRVGDVPLKKGVFPYQSCFEEAAARYGLPLAMLLGLARGESDFQPTIRSKADAYGVMQIVYPDTAGDLGIHTLEELLRPCVNIDAGARYLTRMLKRFGQNFYRAVAAYNYGPGGVPKEGRIKPGANWYAGYIYDHVKAVIEMAATGSEARPVDPTKAVKRYDQLGTIVIEFWPRRERFSANQRLEFIRGKLPDARLDLLPWSPGLLYLSFKYASEEERESIEQTLRENYIEPEGPRPEVPKY